jgi:hypothetical protein
MNRRPLTRGVGPHSGEASPSITLVVRLTLGQPGHDPFVSEHEGTTHGDDAMWRPDASHTDSLGGDTKTRTAAEPTVGAPIPQSGCPRPWSIDLKCSVDDRDVTQRSHGLAVAHPGAPLERPCHPHHHAEVELTQATPHHRVTASSAGRRQVSAEERLAATPDRRDRTESTALTRVHTSDPRPSPGRLESVGRVRWTRSSRLRRPMLIAGVVAVALIGAVALRSTPRPRLSAASPLATTPPPARDVRESRRPALVDDGAIPSAAQTRWILLDGENGPTASPSICTRVVSSKPSTAPASCASTDPSLPEPASQIPGSPCRHLIVSAALTLGADPGTWIVGVLDQGGRPGETLDRVIHDRLKAARLALEKANHSDPEALTALDALDSVITEAYNQPCSSSVCPDNPKTNHSRSTRQRATASAGWYWTCDA